MREKILKAAKVYLEGRILYHEMNVELILENPVAVPEHPDIMQTLEEELAKLAEYEDKLFMLRKFGIEEDG
jgi:hypothetical protein